MDRMAIKQLTKFCHYYQKFSKSLGRFRFTLQDNINFNYNIIVDIMYISGSPLLYIINKGTRFQASR